jgi:hypothetical protein
MRDHDDYHPMTFFKACHALYLVKVKRLSQTKAAILLDVNVGQISHVVNGHRYPEAFPVSPDEPEETKH